MQPYNPFVSLMHSVHGTGLNSGKGRISQKRGRNSRIVPITSHGGGQVAGASRLRAVGGELVYRLPLSQITQFPDLLETLEAHGERETQYIRITGSNIHPTSISHARAQGGLQCGVMKTDLCLWDRSMLPSLQRFDLQFCECILCTLTQRRYGLSEHLGKG